MSDNTRLDGKIAIVTGAASPLGLGFAMTSALLRAGARVAMMDIDAKALDEAAELARQIGGPTAVATIVADATVPFLRDQGWGRVIGVTTSLDTMLRTMPYGPSKAGHEALMAVLAIELEGTGVTANVLVPGGPVDTNMTRGGSYGSLLRPEVMQEPVVWLASEESDGFHGRRIVARHWDGALAIEARLERASAPAAWPQLGRPAEERD